MSNSLATRNTEDLISLDRVSDERKNQIMAIKDSIVFSYDATLNYAGDASRNLTEFSSDLLKTIKLKESPEVEGLLTELVSNLEKVDIDTLCSKKPGFLQRLFKVNEVKQFITRYEDIDGVLKTVTDKLAMANFQLLKDMEYCSRLIEQTKQYIFELDNYIKAGRIRLQEERESIAAMEENFDANDKLAVYDLNDRKNEVDRFERKLDSLFILENVAIQNLPQIDLIRSGNSVLIEKIDTSITNVIPLWQQQMAIALELMRQRGALALEQAVTQTTNNLIAKNSELLKTNSLEIARSLETPIVDIATLKQSSQNLIETLNGIKQIREEGKQSRLKAAQELGQLQIQLNEQLLLVSGK